MKGVCGSGSIAPPFLISALVGGEWSASRIFCFTPWETTLDTNWIGGWVGLKAGLDAVEKRTKFAPSGDRTPAVNPVPRRYANWALSQHVPRGTGKNHEEP
jgi:hypothetical protein